MIHTGTQTIYTERLILRRFALSDVDAVYNNWVTDPAVTKYLIWEPHRHKKETKSVIKRWLKEYRQHDFYQWAIVLKETNQPIGSIGVADLRNDISMMRLGYCIGQRWWQQGITAEALLAVIDFLFRELKVNRIEAWHDINNPNSGRVMQKCGLQYEGTLRQADRNNQGIHDASVYALLAEDYFAQAADS